MNDFEFPTNVKQIGSISGHIKLYMEDYVCSYLQQYAAMGGYGEKLAVLIGRQMVIDGQKIIFISGAVQARHTERKDNIELFTDETWEDIYEQINTYFSGFEIVGWMQSQPGYGVHLNANYGNYHFELFKEKHQVLFVVDPLERCGAFFIADYKKKELNESKGYFIYYEKNKNMHEYMLNNKVIKVNAPEDIELAGKEEDYENDEDIISSDRSVMEKIAIRFPSRGSGEPRTRPPDNKRLINMLVSLSALLLVICFIMGIGLIQNEDRITKLEASLSELSTTYAAALEQVKNVRSEQVFAAQPDEETSTVDTSDFELIPIEDPVQTIQTPEENDTISAEPEPEENDTISTEPEPTTQEVSRPVENANIINIPEVYTIRDGDNLLYISNYFYGTSAMVNAIMEANGITDPDKINIGDELKLPRAVVD